MPHPPNFITRFAKTQEIARQKPHFLLNAALHERHCIIGRDSPIETLLVLLRRPWCVLEICVSNRHEKNTGVLEAMLTFARTAQEFDYAGYRTAVFLLEYELLARARTRVYCHSHAMKQGECFGRANAESKGYSFNSSRRVYAMCNTVFLPSLMSFNSFWIRLICVCAIELGVSFSCMINMLCDQKRSQKQATIFSPDLVMPVGVLRHACRRQSEIDMASFWRSREKVVDDHIDESIVEKMLGLYRDVLRRTGDYI
ncbi:hypothetical protein UA08_05222 [Talaromyces atroroseus]|uniref:Uncharacterized protein n=1 Tax=Talaromyces atroroseus TaxID=1441469 RepID=A0A225ALV0_TALAT|nr:hypothetical protein UA08_05222 [Talaromyces atroroseus]OKL59294.1 hypothetical protein UA08_05222 [Talaromyces atroroseus]